MYKIWFLVSSIILFLFTCQLSVAQEKEPVVDKVINFPNSFLNKVQNKYANLEDLFPKKT